MHTCLKSRIHTSPKLAMIACAFLSLKCRTRPRWHECEQKSNAHGVAAARGRGRGRVNYFDTSINIEPSLKHPNTSTFYVGVVHERVCKPECRISKLSYFSHVSRTSNFKFLSLRLASSAERWMLPQALSDEQGAITAETKILNFSCTLTKDSPRVATSRHHNNTRRL